MYINKVREKMPNGRTDLDASIDLVFLSAEEYIKLMIPDLHEEYNSAKELTLELEPWEDDEYKLCLWVGTSKDEDCSSRSYGEHSVHYCPLFYIENSLSKIVKRIDEDRHRLYLLRSAFKGELPF